jgi:DNA anti-recombination protein RmuC
MIMSDNATPDGTAAKKSARASQPIPTADRGGIMGSELETLRELIFGNQAREFSRRLDTLESQLAASRRELQTLIHDTSGAVAQDATAKTTAVRKDLTQKLDKQYAELSARLEQLEETFSAQLRAAQKELSERLDKLSAQQTAQLQTAQAESRQRDDDLRRELLTLTAWLDNKKTSRHDLGDMLLAVAQQLQAEPDAAEEPA